LSLNTLFFAVKSQQKKLRIEIKTEKKEKKKKKLYFFFAPMILNMVVPHLVHLPFMALRFMPPLPFIATSLASAIMRLALHFTQYPSVPTIG